MKIAITGGIGCGKSTLMKLLKEQFSHIPQFSMDSFAHEALATPEVQQYCLEQFQSTNRKDIGIIIFDPKHKFDMAFLEFKIYNCFSFFLFIETQCLYMALSYYYR